MIGKSAPPLPENGWLVHSAPPIAKRLHPRPYLLHFWATWCGPCKNQLPLVQSLHEAGFTVIGVHPGGGGPEQRKQIQAFVNENALEYPQLIVAKDKGRLAGYPVSIYPHSVLIDGKGYMVAHGFELMEIARTFRQLHKRKED